MAHPEVVRRVLPAVILVLGLAFTGHGETAALEKKRRLGAVAAPVRLIPDGSGPLTVSGLHAYFGDVELRAAGDGLVVVNRLRLERYLLGLEEVPLTWPAEALKAQAVAARTYALWTLSRPRAGAAALYGFDICATVDCQVFSGADAVAARDGLRWAGAVQETAGEVVLYRGAPILARYHSTSGGQTFENAQIYTDEADYPYLRAVPSTTEENSPLYRWEVRFGVGQLERIMRGAGWWGDEGRLIGARSVPSSTGKHYPDIEYVGRKGTMRTTAEELRVLVRTAAPAMFPGRYPSRWPTSSGRLPETLPSNRVEVTTVDGTVRIVGRGWGHGVGMSQWGAEGLARRGARYRAILAHYYRNTTVGAAPNPPIRVGVGWGRRKVEIVGSFALVDGRGRTLVHDALGTWRFRWAGAGTVAVDPPEGFGLPLEVGIVDAPRRVEVGEPTALTIALSKPALVRAVSGASGSLGERRARVKDAGRRRVVWRAPAEPGRYEVRVQARAGPRRRFSNPVTILVVSATERRARDAFGEDQAPPVPLTVVALVLLLAAIVAVAWMLSSRMRR